MVRESSRGARIESASRQTAKARSIPWRYTAGEKRTCDLVPRCRTNTRWCSRGPRWDQRWVLRRLAFRPQDVATVLLRGKSAQPPGLDAQCQLAPGRPDEPRREVS